LFILRLAALGMVMFGTLADVPLVWNMANLSMACMAIVNLIAILMLSGIAMKLAKDYNQQRRAGKLPTFNINDYPEIQQQVEKGIWDNDAPFNGEKSH
ncbi:alanine:cation symporter family protein, partial [Salmonella enterica subsp. enterica serovar 1,4,[5],12:i:-]|nr:alanine:cation symporter family protein [Salmonella enterica subsp. enterica serovar 1,4,[5],12:i:-]